MARQAACPICAAPTDVKYRPFCSRRCADVDLARWLQGAYAVAGGKVDDDEDGDDAHAGSQSPPPPLKDRCNEDG